MLWVISFPRPTSQIQLIHKVCIGYWVKIIKTNIKWIHAFLVGLLLQNGLEKDGSEIVDQGQIQVRSGFCRRNTCRFGHFELNFLFEIFLYFRFRSFNESTIVPYGGKSSSLLDILPEFSKIRFRITICLSSASPSPTMDKPERHPWNNEHRTAFSFLTAITLAVLYDHLELGIHHVGVSPEVCVC